MKGVFLIFFAVRLFAKININTATLKELILFPGIGKTKALRIIKYRKSHPFKSVKNIMNVKGLGKKTYQKIKKEIIIRGKK